MSSIPGFPITENPPRAKSLLHSEVDETHSKESGKNYIIIHHLYVVSQSAVIYFAVSLS